jgi:uncharacterized cupredoxin-like copper-binding protein
VPAEAGQDTLRPMRFLTLAAAALAIVLVLGCGEDRKGTVESQGGATGTTTTPTTTEPAAPTGRAAAKVEVRETEYKLEPKDPKVAKGVTEFKVRNVGDIAHALEVEGPGGEIESGRIEPGRTVTLKVALMKPGRYEWYCPIADHKDRGMKGEITVAGGGGPATQGEDSGGKHRGRSESRSYDPGEKGRPSSKSGTPDSGRGGGVGSKPGAYDY